MQIWDHKGKSSPIIRTEIFPKLCQIDEILNYVFVDRACMLPTDILLKVESVFGTKNIWFTKTIKGKLTFFIRL